MNEASSFATLGMTCLLSLRRCLDRDEEAGARYRNIDDTYIDDRYIDDR